MATRYWVNGNGYWDATNTANWSASSGGAGGASAPTSSDDVVFDANSFPSGGCVITTGSTTPTCKSVASATATNAPKLIFKSTYLKVAGNLDLSGFTLESGMANVGGYATAYIRFGVTSAIDINLGSNTNLNVNIDNQDGSASALLAVTLSSNISLSDTAYLNLFSFNAASSFQSNNYSISAGSVRTYLPNVSWGTGTVNVLGTDSYAYSRASNASGFYWPGSGTVDLTTMTVSCYGDTGIDVPESHPIGTVNFYGERGVLVLPSTGGSITTLNADPGFSLTLRGNAISRYYLTIGTLAMDGTPPLPTILTNSNLVGLTKASGIVTLQHCALTNIVATGGATWNAVSCEDNGGNTGWNFIGSYNSAIHAATPSHIGAPTH